MTSLAWLLLGDEIYGLRQAIRNLLLGVRPHVGNDAIRLVCLRDGAFARELRGDGFVVSVLEVPEAPLAALRGRVDPVKAVTDALWNGTLLTRALTRDLRADTPTLLNVVWPALLPSACLAARRTHTRVAFHEMNNVGEYPGRINTRIFSALLRRCDGFALPCSEFISRALGPSFTSRVLPLAANVGAFSPPTPARRSAARERLGLAPDAYVVGVVARLDPPKGQHHVIDALARPECADVHAVIAGGSLEAEYGRSLVQRAKDNGVADRVVFTGPVTAPEDTYDALDLVLNTRVDPEPLGLSVIEAIVMELPVVAHDLGGPAETLRMTGGGVPLAPLDAATLAAAIDGVRRGRPSLDMREARRIAAAHFSIEAVGARYLTCTSELGVAL